MKRATWRAFSWILVIALVAPMALPAAASSSYVKSGGGKKPVTSAAPLAGAAQDAAPTPEAGIGQTAAASQPITTTGILTGVVLPAVDLPLSATGVVTWNMSAPDAAVSLPSPLLTMSADPFQIVPGGVITYSVAITNVAGAPLARVALDSPLPTGVVYVAQSGVGFSYSPRDQRLSWAIERIEPGRGLRGSFQLRAIGLGIGQIITNTVSAASADAPLVTASAVVEVAPPRQNRVWATPG
ncbi:MAG TPA: hypothetical protein PK170_12215, partial [Anaerolineae bacterium]|nr:hypothetical protein [Anaerolineae bacterium]